VSSDNPARDAAAFAAALDEHLQEINDDYRVERCYALRNIRVRFLPHETFYNWLEDLGKLNGQAKIPRVLKGSTQENWEAYLGRLSGASKP
jgi:hypothetical protein